MNGNVPSEAEGRGPDRLRTNMRGVHLRDLDIFKSEFADTISNYFLYLTVRDLLLEDEDFDIGSFEAKYQIPIDAFIFLKDNIHKISFATKSVDSLKKIRQASDEEFQLMQKCIIVYLGKSFEFSEVMNMREIFGIR